MAPVLDHPEPGGRRGPYLMADSERFFWRET